MASLIQDWLHFSQSLAPEWMLLIDWLICNIAVLLLLRLFGAFGLTLFIVVAVIGANIQVLTASNFTHLTGFLETSLMPLGTILFSTSYLATDSLTEFYGKKAAQRSVFLGFAGAILFTIMMLVALGYRTLTVGEAGEDMAWARENYGHMLALFLPIPAIIAASVCSYLISQMNDIWVFLFIRWLTKSRFLWLRASLSTALSGLVDNIIFNTLAWVVFSENPISFEVLLSYIFGTYLIRVFLALTEAPVIELARFFVPKRDRQAKVMQNSKAMQNSGTLQN